MCLGIQRTPLADTKCSPVAQRKQAKRACNQINIDRVLIVRILLFEDIIKFVALDLNYFYISPETFVVTLVTEYNVQLTSIHSLL